MSAIVKKPSAMIQTNVSGLTAVQRKLINTLVYLAQKDGSRPMYQTSLSTLRTMCNIKSTENVELKQRLKELVSITIEFNYLNKDKETWRAMSLLSEAGVDQETNTVEFVFPPTLNEKIIQPKLYSPLDVMMIANLKSPYAIILYEFLRDYIDSPAIPKMTIEQLRNLLGLEDGKYPEFKDLKRYVLEKSVEEINTQTDLVCKYKLIKQSGNKYTHIKFKAKRNKKAQQMVQQLEFKGMEEPLPEPFLNHPNLAHGEAIAVKLNMKKETVLQFIDKYELPRVQEAFDYTLSEPRTNPAGFFRKALEDGYAIPAAEIRMESNKVRELRQQAKKCYGKEFGNCGSTGKPGPDHACHYCQKWGQSSNQGEVRMA